MGCQDWAPTERTGALSKCILSPNGKNRAPNDYKVLCQRPIGNVVKIIGDSLLDLDPRIRRSSPAKYLSEACYSRPDAMPRVVVADQATEAITIHSMRSWPHE